LCMKWDWLGLVWGFRESLGKENGYLGF